jgi:CO/xanthine dehydrogenase Mo-binding subunit
MKPYSKVSRRNFMKGSAALVVGFGATGLIARFGLSPSESAAQGINGAPSNQLDSWIAIAADGKVTAYTGKCELGHGLHTAQTQLIAEELSVPFERVSLLQCDTGVTPDQGTTSGAQSHPTNFNQANLALAGATAREVLIQRASERLNIPTQQLVVREGIVMSRTDASKRVTYGELIAGAKFGTALNTNAARMDDPREAHPAP